MISLGIFLFENVVRMLFAMIKPLVVQNILIAGFEQGDFAMENMVHQDQCQLLATAFLTLP